MPGLPPYHAFPVLRSGDIMLRQVTDQDAKEIREISYYDGVAAGNDSEAITMNNRIHQDYLEGNTIHWAIIDISSDTLAGTCGYYRGFSGDAGELGYVLRPGFEGKGYMTKALKLAIDFGLTTMGLQKIVAVTDKDNAKSQAVLKRLNFSEEKQEGDYLIFAFYRN